MVVLDLSSSFDTVDCRPMTCGVPRGLMLGPLLFNLYTLCLGQIIHNNYVTYHSFEDDTQIYLACSPNDSRPLDPLCQCSEKTNSWVQSSFLPLNQDKTEIIIFGNKMKIIKVAPQLESRELKTKTQVRN